MLDISGQGLAKAVTKYWTTQTSQQDAELRVSCVYQALIERHTKGKMSLTASVAISWPKRLGFEWKEVRKGVCIDGHEKPDMVFYRQQHFLPTWKELEKRMPKWSPSGAIDNTPLPPGQRLLIPCAHDECTFHSNNGRHHRWIHKDKHLIRKKSRGQALMVSDFILSCNRLEMPSSIPLPPILQQQDIEPVPGLRINPCQATEYIKVGQGFWWKGQNLIDHVVNVVIPIFEVTFPNAQALFLFDHATSHTADAPDALSASYMYMDPGGKQPHLRQGWYYKSNEVTFHYQKMSFDQDDLSVPERWRGKPKGCKIVLQERGLWPAGGLRHDCKSKKSKADCSHLGNACCARRLFFVQLDFLEQKSCLQKEIESRGHLCLFFPKFHYELNWIEYRWGRAKWYTRKNCQYNWPSLIKTVQKALQEIPSLLLLKYWWKSTRILDAYYAGLQYGTEQFTNVVYKSHRRVSLAQTSC